VSAADRPLPGSRALVASADRRLRDRVRVGLGGTGMFCDEVTSARAALERLESMGHDYALVVVDMDLPGAAPGAIEDAAKVAVPHADVIRCGARRPGAEGTRGVWIGKPVDAAEIACVVQAMRSLA
jgi:hypothetical protein